jgi:hypothetical protein
MSQTDIAQVVMQDTLYQLIIVKCQSKAAINHFATNLQTESARNAQTGIISIQIISVNKSIRYARNITSKMELARNAILDMQLTVESASSMLSLLMILYARNGKEIFVYTAQIPLISDQMVYANNQIHFA